METKISTSDLNLYYGNNHALKNINLDIYENQITAFIGPSGCGKSTYLKTLNRRRGYLRSEGRYDASSQEGRHGISAAEPISDEYL